MHPKTLDDAIVVLQQILSTHGDIPISTPSGITGEAMTILVRIRDETVILSRGEYVVPRTSKEIECGDDVEFKLPSGRIKRGIIVGRDEDGYDITDNWSDVWGGSRYNDVPVWNIIQKVGTGRLQKIESPVPKVGEFLTELQNLRLIHGNLLLHILSDMVDAPMIVEFTVEDHLVVVDRYEYVEPRTSPEFKLHDYVEITRPTGSYKGKIVGVDRDGYDVAVQIAWRNTKTFHSISARECRACSAPPEIGKAAAIFGKN